MDSFWPFSGLLLLFLLIRPSTINMQNYGGNYNYPNGYGNGYGGGTTTPYYPYYGNGYGFCYVNQPYCTYNYIPPNFLPYLPMLLAQILRSLNLQNLGSLFNTLGSTSPLNPNLLNMLQQNNPPIYNAANQLYGAYNGMDPAMQNVVRQFCAAMLPALQNAASSFNSLSPQQTQAFDQNMPQLANFLRSQGMRQFASDPSPFGSQPNQLPIGQNPQMPVSDQQGSQIPQQFGAGPNQQQSVPQQGQPGNVGSNGGGLVSGILGAAAQAASSALQGRK